MANNASVPPAQSEPESPATSGLVKSVKRLFEQLGTMRLLATCLFVVFAVYVAGFSWNIPLIQDAERAFYDVRASVFAKEVDQDDRILMILYDDQTLINTGQRSPLDRTILANTLANIDGFGAKGIGIDILFDQAQDDDAILKNVLRSMETPTYLAYATSTTTEESISYEQDKFLTEFLASVTTEKTKPASIVQQSDTDGVVRRWPVQPKSLPPLLANSLTPIHPEFRNYHRSINYRTAASKDRPVFNRLPIDIFNDPETSEFLRDQVAGKYVLIGGDIFDIDQKDTPLTRIADPKKDEKTSMIGLEVHAHILAQLLDGYMPGKVPSWALWTIAVLVVLAGALSALSTLRAGGMALLYVGQFLFIIILPIGLHKMNVDTLFLPTFGWVLGWVLGYAAVGSAARTIGSKQRAFAQSALGKYLPASIAGEILKDPDKLSLHGEKKQIIAIFTDLEGFTKLSHAIEPEMVAKLLNDYLDRLSAVVLEYGGTIDKFVGDAVVAFWGAPIAYDDDGDRALRAAYALYQAGEDFRRDVPEGVPPIGRTRVGMHFGEAIIGNFGGDGRMQYTALGDAMNTAARLEAANKPLDTKILVSKEAAERTSLDWFRSMGRITLRGRSTPVEIFEPRPDWDAVQRQLITDIVQSHEAGDEKAVSKLTAILPQFDSDDALKNLRDRLQETSKGESYVLG